MPYKVLSPETIYTQTAKMGAEGCVFIFMHFIYTCICNNINQRTSGYLSLWEWDGDGNGGREEYLGRAEGRKGKEKSDFFYFN